MQLRAISAVAGLDAAKERRIASSCGDLDNPAHCRDYYIAGGDLSLTAPGLAALGAALTGSGGVAAWVDQAVNGLAGNNGPVAQALAGVETILAPLLGDSGLTVRLGSNVENSLDRIVNQPLTDGVVRIDLATGRITVDLEELLGIQLHKLPPNTELLTPELINDVATRVAGLLQELPGQVQAALTSALNVVTLSIEGSVCAVGTGDDCSLAGVLDPTTNLPVTLPDLASVIGDGGVIDPEDLKVLEPVLGGLLDLSQDPLSVLSTSGPDQSIAAAAVTGLRVSVDAGGTLAQVLDGTATAVVTLESPAGEATLDIEDAVLDAIAVPITTALSADNAALDAAVASVTGAITQALAALAPGLAPLTDFASLRVNVQEAGPVAGSFREVALRLTLGQAAGSGGLATLDLARAQVGPNALPAQVEQPPVVEPPAEQPPLEEPPAEEPPTTKPEEGQHITVLPAAGAPDVMPLAFLGGLMMVAGTGLLLAGRRTIPVMQRKA